MKGNKQFPCKLQGHWSPFQYLGLNGESLRLSCHIPMGPRWITKKQQGTSSLGDHASGSAVLGKAEGTAGSFHVSLLLGGSTEAGQPGYTAELTHLFYTTNHQHFGGTCLATLATLKHGLNWSLSLFPHQFFSEGWLFSPNFTFPSCYPPCVHIWPDLCGSLDSSLCLQFGIWGQQHQHPSQRDRLCGGDVWWIHVYNHYEVFLQSPNRKWLFLIAAVSPIGQLLGSDQHDALPKALMPFVQGRDSSWAEPPSHRLFL